METETGLFYWHRIKFGSLNFSLWTLKNLPDIRKIIQKVRDKLVEYISINSLRY